MVVEVRIPIKSGGSIKTKMSKPIIKVENLSKQYRIGAREAGYGTFRESLIGAMKAPLERLRRGGSISNDDNFWALKDINFEVQPGEVLGIIGRNGAGKSTLLKVLSRITEPTTGSIKLYGRVASLLEVGTGFHPELTGRENIFLNGAILGMGKREIDRQFDEIVDFAEVEKFLDTPVKRYSSGMYLRLAFAVAAHLEPEILVVDEVLAVGDAQFQKKCMGKMNAVAKEGRTVLFVSHNMNAVEQLCSTAIRLESGMLREHMNDVRRVIKEHLFQDDAISSGEWINSDGLHNSDWFAPSRFAIVNEQGQRLPMPTKNDEEMWLEIEGNVHLLDPAFNIGYAIYSEDGHMLYWCFTTDSADARWPKIHKGKFLLRTKIPQRLLNEGLYRVELLASLHHRKWLLEPGSNAPCIYFTIQGGLSDSPYWMTKRPGLLAPVLEWNDLS